MDRISCNSNGGKMAGVKNISQSKSETPVTTMRNEDEDAEMDTTQADGYGQDQRTGGDTHPVCMETNGKTPVQNEENNKTMAKPSSPPRGAIGYETGKRIEQPMRDSEEGTTNGHSGGEKEDPVTHTSEDTMTEETTSPKRTKNYASNAITPHPREREREVRPGHKNLVVTRNPYDAYIHSGVPVHKWHNESDTD
jgi:hypothetical protein